MKRPAAVASVRSPWTSGSGGKRGMRKALLIFVVTSCVCNSGCYVGPVRTADMQNHPDVRHIDPKKGPVRIDETKEDDTIVLTVEIRNFTICTPAEPVRMKYDEMRYRLAGVIAVTGVLPNGKECNVYLDTGAERAALVSDVVVREGKLAIYPVGKGSWSSAFGGICHLPWIQLGPIRVLNPPCQYAQLHWEARLLGMPLWRDKPMILGLGALRRFPYVMFDNVRKEVEFAPKNGLFEPENPDRWELHPFRFERDRTDNLRIQVDLPIAGEDLRGAFDTCSPSGLHLGPKEWRKLSARVATGRPRNSTMYSAILGPLRCQRATVGKLEVGSRTIRNAEVVILPEDSRFGTETTIGMGYFTDTVVVLDFERELMWIKRRADS